MKSILNSSCQFQSIWKSKARRIFRQHHYGGASHSTAGVTRRSNSG